LSNISLPTRPSAAERWIDELEETLSKLASFPLIGEQVGHLAPGIRRICLGKYLVFYAPIEGGIELRRVLHGARRIEDLFRS
jgi:toxin ParE1/3/4